MKENKVIAATDASCEDEYMAGAWIVEEDVEIESDENIVWSKKQKRDALAAVEALIVLDLVQKVAITMKNENEGVLKMHMDCKVVWEMLIADRLKDK